MISSLSAKTSKKSVKSKHDINSSLHALKQGLEIIETDPLLIQEILPLVKDELQKLENILLKSK